MLTMPADDRPKLLMLSHCVPHALGGSSRARTWQLLRQASQTHQIYLIATLDAPVCLSQWQPVYNLTRRMVLETRPRLWRGPRIGHTLSAWHGAEGFDAVMVTHPSLWRHIASMNQSLRLCDLHGAPTNHPLERHIAEDCDVVLLGRASQAGRFAGRSAPTLVMPESVDLNYFTPAADAGEARLRLVYHGDSRPRRVATREWFERRVWPQVHKAVPAAHLETSAAVKAMDALHALRSASVVVAPPTEDGRTHWPVLQAMAMARPVIAPQQAAQDLGARHGEHLLMARDEQDWVEQCVQSLRCASIRLQLAKGARHFVESHCPVTAGVTDALSSALLWRHRPGSSRMLAQAA